MTAPAVVGSLFEAPEPSVIGAAVEWCLSLVSGPLVTAIATVAVAGIGFALLAGRIPVRRAASVVVGIFMLAGAGAVGSRALERETSGENRAIVPNPPALKPPQDHQPTSPSTVDPYAGASVPSY